MSYNNTQSPPPPPPTSKGRRKIAFRVVLGGVVFAFLPLIVTLVASLFVDDAFNEGTSSFGALPWLMFLTIPTGGVIVLIGLIIVAANMGRSKR